MLRIIIRSGARQTRAAGPGFEPELMAPKATVLPLDDPASVSLGGLEPPTYSLKGSHSAIELQALGDPTGIRTQVTRLKTSCPSPLDDGALKTAYFTIF